MSVDLNWIVTSLTLLACVVGAHSGSSAASDQVEPVGDGGFRSYLGDAAPVPEENRDDRLIRTYAACIPGDVVVAGCGFRATGGPLGSGDISIAGIPATAVVVRAILNWAIIDYSPPGPPTAFVNGTAVGGISVIADDRNPCWFISTRSIYGYTADVTSLVTGNGTYTIRVRDSGATSTSPTVEGAALIVIYQDCAMPGRCVVVYEGAETLRWGASNQTVTGFTAGAIATAADADVWLVICDGSDPQGSFDINGGNIASGGFQGDDATCSPLGLYYDVDSDRFGEFQSDPASVLSAGATTLTARLTANGDCYTWSAFVLSVLADPAVVTLPPGCACGNGGVDPGEECDDGSGNSDTLPDACRLDCTLPHCGDGVVDGNEQCDDGNSIPGDGCSDCQIDACLVAGIRPVQRVMAHKSPDLISVVLTWSPDPAASGYNTWYVQTKTAIPLARDPGGPGVTSVPGCHPSISTSCWHFSAVAVSTGWTVFYQVRGACAGTEAAD